MGSSLVVGPCVADNVGDANAYTELSDGGRPVHDSPRIHRKRTYSSLGTFDPGQMKSDVLGDLDDIGLRELLEHDPRPTFIIDLLLGPAAPALTTIPEPVFCNKSFQSHAGFVDIISGRAVLDSTSDPGVPSYADFSLWVRHTNDHGDANNSTASSISFAGFSWAHFTIRRRWRVIGCNYGTTDSNLTSGNDFAGKAVFGNEQVRDAKTQLDPSTSTSIIDDDTSSITSYIQTSGTPDWTAPHPVGEMSPHIQFARSVDWGATPLGAISTWSREFRQIANLVMGNPHPCALFWGEELTAMYNQAYAEGIAGYKHPGLMGTGLSGPFKEIWSSIGGMFAECRRTGKAVVVTDQMLSIERHGFLEESSFSWTLTPLYGGGSKILGFYNAPFETTRQMLNDRRTRTLLRLGEEVALAQNVSNFWDRFLKGIEGNQFEFPFVLLYSKLKHTNSDSTLSISSEDSTTSRCYALKGALGVPEGHKAAPTHIDMSRIQEGFSLAFRDAMGTGKPSVIRTVDGSLSESLTEGFSWRGFGDPCKEAVICPIRATTGEDVLGFLVVGVNPRRPYDKDYQLFIQLLNRQLSVSLASVTLFEEEIRREHTAAEVASFEKLKLSKELAVQTSRLQRIAEVSPVGMFSINAKGLLIEANDRWYAITGHSKEAVYEMSWMDVIDDSSLSVMKDGWHRLTVDRVPWSAELRLKKPWQDPLTREFFDHWGLAELQPEFSEDGSVRSIIGSITDITLQKRSAEDALARARLSEQLLLRTQEAKENEKNFKRFSDLAPGGLVIMDADGKIMYANSQWFEISGHPHDPSVSEAPLSWTKAISEEDLPYFTSKWDEMKTSHVTITMEVRMQKPWDSQRGNALLRKQRWILASMFPEVSEDGVLMSVMGCITDISQMKWAEGVQIRRLAEAEENRQQQNNFIDITSHEMRNPLSAIIQCADGISSSLSKHQAASSSQTPEMAEAIRSSIDNAETILLCAQHQKSVVDDILTLSKLDSNLLHITPVTIQPVKVVRQALKMFDSELQRNDIEMDLHIEKSLQELQVDKVMLDPSRLLQILINLLTNAIKFTKSAARRSIIVSVGAYLTPPPDTDDSFEYIPTRITTPGIALGSEWGPGELIYLRFEVRDTGCGLTPDQKKLLFMRFSQASPQTHVQYGGSGLGLFISRQLTELHGGKIGVASEAGVGSTFAFYVKSRRSDSDPERTIMNTQLPLDFRADIRRSKSVPKSREAKKAMNSLNFGASTSASAGTSRAMSVSASSPVISNILSASKLPIMALSPSDYHILIVEDNLVNQKVLAAQIRKLGCTVYLANHGEALTLLKESRFWKGRKHDGKDLSIILMDLEMPVMDGLTCVRKIREMQADGEILGHVPIIAVTANARGEQIAAAKDSGMDDVMSKPFRVPQLVQKIEGLLRRLEHAQ